MFPSNLKRTITLPDYDSEKSKQELQKKNCLVLAIELTNYLILYSFWANTETEWRQLQSVEGTLDYLCQIT